MCALELNSAKWMMKCKQSLLTLLVMQSIITSFNVNSKESPQFSFFFAWTALCMEAIKTILNRNRKLSPKAELSCSLAMYLVLWGNRRTALKDDSALYVKTILYTSYSLDLHTQLTFYFAIILLIPSLHSIERLPETLSTGTLYFPFVS